MKRLHLLLLRSFIGPFFLIFFIVLFVLLMQFLWRYIDELIGKGLEISVIAEFLLYTSATLVPMALPLSILMSSLMTFGNLGEKYELTAMKASGISLQKIMKPIVITTFAISIGAFYFANNILPYANLQMRSLLYDIRSQSPELQLKPGEFSNLVDGYSIRIHDKNEETGVMYQIQIYNHTEKKGNVSVILADSGTMKMTADEQNLLMTLYSGQSYNEMGNLNQPRSKRTYPHRYDSFEKQEIIIKLTGFNLERSDKSLFKDHYAMMNLKQLSAHSDTLQREIEDKENGVYRSLTKNMFKKRGKKPLSKDKTTPPAKIEEAKPAPRFKDKEPPLLKREGQFGKKDIGSSQKEQLPPETEMIHPEPVNTMDLDSLFNTLTLREKKQIGTTAISYVRNAKNQVGNFTKAYDSKVHHLRRFEVEWQRKFTIAVACLVFLFIGAPLGAIIRKGGLGLPLVLSVIFFILYYILSLTFEKLVRESIVPDYQGMWMPTGIFALAGGFLTYQATTDSSMLNIDTYLNFLKKYFGQKFNVVDMLNIDKEKSSESQAHIDKINAAIFDLEKTTERMLEESCNNIRIGELISSIFTPQNESSVIIYERYYNNTFRTIINHNIFNKKSVRDKLYEFPSFNQNEMGDKKRDQLIRIILACTVVLLPLVALRQFMKIFFVRTKLKKIKQLLPELSSIINRYEFEY